MFHWFENLIDPFKYTPPVKPPDTILAFYWYYIRQAWPIFCVALITGFCAAIVEVSLFTFVGQLVDLLKSSKDAGTFFADHSTLLIWMAFVALVLRPVLFGLHSLIIDQAINPSFTNLVRWQTHRYIVRQSVTFFQNDFAGRIANKVMQTGPSLRESVVQSVDALWFVAVYSFSALVLFASLDIRLALPLIGWIVSFSALLGYFVPRIKNRSAIASETRSSLTGRIVDSYTNIQTLKLFAHADLEDHHAREAMDDVVYHFRALSRQITIMEIFVWSINGILIVSTLGLALWLWTHNLITIGAIALAAGLIIRINNMAGWVMWVVTSIFENIGTVQEGMETISQPIAVLDNTNATDLTISKGEIRYEGIYFDYGKDSGMIDKLTLTIRAGEKVGLVGRSGAGKSTLVNLLLRFYDLSGGRILIDGQDISKLTQSSVRSQIGVVSQDTSLLHRSIIDNIRYGNPEAGINAAIEAARMAQAHEFILELEDSKGRKSYQAHVGERGVKLSGGQRQRIAIARVLLKDAPILVMDEATSALDSEVEAAIQEQLYNLMHGKTVIAIAHRLSTIAALDRLVIMDQGRIVEQGSHSELLERGGLYSELWKRQSGGFLLADPETDNN